MPLQTISALARQTVSCAFAELERTITAADARNFGSTTLEQVRSDVLKLENELAARQSLRNMQRLAPLFQGLEHYAKVMDILCNGTPFLPWIWAPISLILRIASEHLEAFDLIIKGYSRIAECLGRFSVLSGSFKGNQDFQQTFAVFYADILEFHKHAYEFVRRRSWKLFFLTSWHRFQRRFDNIFENLQRHEALIDKEANAYNIAEARQMRRDIRAWREESDQKFKQNEKEQSFQQFESIVSWLKIDESDQLHIFHTLLEEATRYPGTCDWVLRNEKMKSILKAQPDVPLLWVQGAAGTGKSVLASSIVNFAISAGSLVLSHFCNYAYPSSTKYEWMLKSLLLQLVRKDIDLAGHVFNSCVESKKAPSLPVLETLLRFLLSNISKEPRKTSYVWIIIDGIEECELPVQNKLFNLISQVTSTTSNSDEVVCKAMIFCRFSSSASAKLRRSKSLSLAEEQQYVSMSIRRYAAQRLQSIYSKFEQMSLTMDDIKEIEDAITEKADGMFLYARLVLEYLSSNIFFSGEEIKMSVYELPAKLSEFYSKIITQILVRLDKRSVDRVKCALGWIAFSQRPLKKIECLSAIAFSTGDTSVKHAAPQFMLDICAPLVEEKPDSRLGFIHVSIKEFLQSSSSNLVLVKDDCLLQHGIATVTCLLAGIEAFTNGPPNETILVGTIKGLHGFHIYSKEYWTDYLLSLIPPEIAPGSTTATLFNLAVELAKRLNGLSKNSDEVSQGQKYLRGISQLPTKFIDARIATLQSPFLQTAISGCLQARSEDQLETELKDLEAQAQSIDNILLSAIPSPQNGVSLILQEYQAMIRCIIDQSDYPGVTAAELESFKRQFRNCAYTCRVKGCVRATEGFQRQAQCLEHEILHVRRLRCTYSGCQYPPFGSSTALKAHINKHHHPTPQKRRIRKLGANGLAASSGNSMGAATTSNSVTTIPPLNMQSKQQPLLRTQWSDLSQLPQQTQWHPNPFIPTAMADSRSLPPLEFGVASDLASDSSPQKETNIKGSLYDDFNLNQWLRDRDGVVPPSNRTGSWDLHSSLNPFLETNSAAPPQGFSYLDRSPRFSKAEEDDDDDGVLSPPPSSSVSSVDPAMLGDEIMVGTENETAAANGDKSSTLQVISDKEDDGDDGVLSPPPSSSVSSVDPAMLGDEIMVGTENETAAANGDKSSPLQVTLDKEDVEMAEAGGETPASHYPKRKRSSMYDNLGEDKLEDGSPISMEDAIAAVRHTNFRHKAA